jgi:RNA polymerase-binding transcription factor DksA
MKNENLRPRQGTQKHPALKKRVASAKADAVAKILGRVPAASQPAGSVPAKWRWHYRLLLSLQSRLLRERGVLLRVSAQPLEPHSMDEADSATDEFDHDLALTQLSADQNALYEVNGALERILDGRYGVCEESGRTIPAARLKAVPWTRFTREVEERLERKGAVPRAGLNKAVSVRGQGQIQLASEEEEDGEKPSVLANDETLARVFSPPGRRVPPQKISKRSPRAAKRKGRSTPDS